MIFSDKQFAIQMNSIQNLKKYHLCKHDILSFINQNLCYTPSPSNSANAKTSHMKHNKYHLLDINNVPSNSNNLPN